MTSFDYFKLLASVPHGSGNTEKISELLTGFAREQGLRCLKDEPGNLVIYRPGSAGREEEPPVILQAHMDMVVATDPDCTKDMLTEGLDLKTDGTFVWAEGTSLGADDCAGVCMIMDVLADPELSHPPIEAVITVEEETGMNGAKAFDVSVLNGKRMINLDSTQEGVFTVGCAGGTRTECSVPLELVERPQGDTAVKIDVGGLLGGHSGGMIHLRRGNANILMGRILYGLSMKYDVRLCAWEGGTADNAIPSRCFAAVSVPPEQKDEVIRLAKKHILMFAKELGDRDPGLFIEAEELQCGCMQTVSRECSKGIFRLVASMPDGLRKMSEELEGVVQTSLNMGVARTEVEEGRFYLECFIRSLVTEDMDGLLESVRENVERAGGTVHLAGQTPPWVYVPDSPLRSEIMKIYREQTGKDGSLAITHGCLECGIFSDRIGGFDCVSFCPDIFDVHSPREKMDIASLARTTELLKEAMRRI